MNWAEGDGRVSALVVYGSVAVGRDKEYSDIDLVVVADDGHREGLWNERETLCERMLAAPVAFAHEVTWQRPYRYQAWPTGFDTMVDLTIDEGALSLWRGLVDGCHVVFDRAGIAANVARDLERWEPPPVDLELVDSSAWPWLGYLDANARNGNSWMVRSGIHDFVKARALPLLAGRSDATERDLSAEDIAALHEACPRSASAEDLARAIRRSAQLYVRALDRYTTATGVPRPNNPMEAAMRRRLGA